MPLDLKPFLHEAEIMLDKGEKLTLTMDYRVIHQLEQTFGRSMNELIGELASSLSMMTQFLWAMSRKHHSDLDHDQIAGLQYSPKHGRKIAAALGKIVREAFNLKVDGADGQ